MSGPAGPPCPWPSGRGSPQTRKPPGGTTTFLARDASGDIAAGVSTCGWAFKYPGRLGDSPVIGAGIYADNRYGAAACTGHGELTIRAGTARSVVLYLKMGMTLEAACAEALNDLRALKREFQGGVTIHAIDAAGRPYVTAIGRGGGLTCWLWEEGMAAPEERSVAAVDW